MSKKLLMSLVAACAILLIVVLVKKKGMETETAPGTSQEVMEQAQPTPEQAMEAEFAEILKESGITEEEILAETDDEEFPDEYEGLMDEEEGIYSDQFDESYLTDGQKKVLFFHAAWCPSCRAHDAMLMTKYPSVGLLPIYKVDFDTETALRERFGVVQQHTFVKVSGRGNVIAVESYPSEEGLMEFLRS